jgi:peptidyl-prolyl cis-trans isomerase D
MLNILRKHATSWLIKVAFFIIVIVFIFWGGYSYQSREANRLAKVHDRFITFGEYNRTYHQMLDNYRRQFGKMLTEEMLERLNLKQQALELLINRQLLLVSAETLGLTVTAEETQQAVFHYGVFQSDGHFDYQRYQQVLRQNRMTPEMFEAQLAEDLTIRKVEAFIKRQVMVTKEEIHSDFLFNHTQVVLAYVTVDPGEFAKQVTWDEGQLTAYYQENQSQYQDPERRQFALVTFKPEQFAGEVTVSEREITGYYEDHRKKYHTGSAVRARHILFKVDEGAAEEQVAKVRGDAQKVLTEARKGTDFAQLAKKHSQDGTAAKGGDLGFFTREAMVPEFSEAAFSLQAGEMSDLVRSPFGFHIIKVEEVRPEKTSPLEEVRADVEQQVRLEKARDLINRLARDLADAAFAEKDLRKGAQGRKVEVETTPWLTAQDPLPGLGPNPKVMQSLFLKGPNEISGVLEVPEGVVVAQVMDIRAASTLPMDVARERVERDFRGEAARRLAEAEAARLLAESREANSLEDAARRQSLVVKRTGPFARSKPDETLRWPPPVLDEVFGLDVNRPFPQSAPFTGRQYLVVQLLSRKEPEPGVLSGEETSIRERLEAQRQAAMWQLWLEQQRQQGDVKILHEVS